MAKDHSSQYLLCCLLLDSCSSLSALLDSSFSSLCFFDATGVFSNVCTSIALHALSGFVAAWSAQFDILALTLVLDSDIGAVDCRFVLLNYPVVNM